MGAINLSAWTMRARTVMVLRLFPLVAASLAITIVAGCSATVVSETPPPAGGGTLDFEQAEFRTPLDAYGMSMRDMQIVYAGRAVLLYRCVLGQEALNNDVLANVREWLNESKYPPQRWLFGYWQASWLARLGSLDPPGPSVGYSFAEPEQAKVSVCSQDPEVGGLEAVAPMYGLYGYGPQSGSVVALGNYWMESYQRTEGDSRLLALNRKRNDCTMAKGYSITYPDNGRVGYVTVGEYGPDGSSTAAQLLAALAEAECADNMGYTQQVVDIMSGYESSLIAQHQAELVAIKEVLDGRVAKATQILKGIGVM